MLDGLGVELRALHDELVAEENLRVLRVRFQERVLDLSLHLQRGHEDLCLRLVRGGLRAVGRALHVEQVAIEDLRTSRVRRAARAVDAALDADARRRDRGDAHQLVVETIDVVDRDPGRPGDLKRFFVRADGCADRLVDFLIVEFCFLVLGAVALDHDLPQDCGPSAVRRCVRVVNAAHDRHLRRRNDLGHAQQLVSNSDRAIERDAVGAADLEAGLGPADGLAQDLAEADGLDHAHQLALDTHHVVPPEEQGCIEGDGIVRGADAGVQLNAGVAVIADRGNAQQLAVEPDHQAQLDTGGIADHESVRRAANVLHQGPARGWETAGEARHRQLFVLQQQRVADGELAPADDQEGVFGLGVFAQPGGRLLFSR